ncbi:hypothetical protein Ddc_20437 [Ditylenchus destructor]|nr:hypothetical protein Ddc_20437 [Ditylenchus destructor]
MSALTDSNGRDSPPRTSRERGLLEGLHHRLVAEEAQVAAVLRRARIVRVLLRDVREARRVLAYLGQQLLGLGLRLGLVGGRHVVAGLDQDVAGATLFRRRVQLLGVVLVEARRTRSRRFPAAGTSRRSSGPCNRSRARRRSASASRRSPWPRRPGTAAHAVAAARRRPARRWRAPAWRSARSGPARSASGSPDQALQQPVDGQTLLRGDLLGGLDVAQRRQLRIGVDQVQQLLVGDAAMLVGHHGGQHALTHQVLERVLAHLGRVEELRVRRRHLLTHAIDLVALRLVPLRLRDLLAGDLRHGGVAAVQEAAVTLHAEQHEGRQDQDQQHELEESRCACVRNRTSTTSGHLGRTPALRLRDGPCRRHQRRRPRLDVTSSQRHMRQRRTWGLARTELRHLGLLDLDRLVRARIAARARGPLGHAEGAETHQRHRPVLLERGLHPTDQRLQRTPRGGLGDVRLLGDVLDQFGLVHEGTPSLVSPQRRVRVLEPFSERTSPDTDPVASSGTGTQADRLCLDDRPERRGKRILDALPARTDQGKVPIPEARPPVAQGTARRGISAPWRGFRQRLLQVIDHRPDGQHRGQIDQPGAPQRGVEEAEDPTVVEQEGDGHHLHRRLELAQHVHRHGARGADLRHPLAQRGDRDLAPHDDQRHQRIDAVLLQQHQQRGADQELVRHRIEEGAERGGLVQLRAR